MLNYIAASILAYFVSRTPCDTRRILRTDRRRRQCGAADPLRPQPPPRRPLRVRWPCRSSGGSCTGARSGSRSGPWARTRAPARYAGMRPAFLIIFTMSLCRRCWPASPAASRSSASAIHDDRLRHVRRLRRDRGRAAGPRQSGRHRVRGAAVRRDACGRRPRCRSRPGSRSRSST